MADFRSWTWSKDQPWKVRNSELIKFLTDTGRFISCPVCSHNGNWTFHVDIDLGQTGPDPYMMIYIMDAFSPTNLGQAKYRAGHFALECPKCAHLELIPCQAVANYLERTTSEAKNG